MCSALMACATAYSATVYKWVDEKGVVHYSDQPHAGSDKMEVGGVQTYSSQAPSASVSNSSGGTVTQAAPYQRCAFSRPENDEVFLNTDSVSGTFSLQPGLNPDHHVVVTLDGMARPDLAPQGGGFTISPAGRGSHTLTAVVQDSSGKVVCASPSVTFHVRQPSVQAPNRANRPRF
jgi:hypothetical protein